MQGMPVREIWEMFSMAHSPFRSGVHLVVLRSGSPATFRLRQFHPSYSHMLPLYGRLCRALCSLISAVIGVSALQAQNPAIFIKYSTGQAVTGTVASAATTPIAAPGSGWAYSAAAPTDGTTWNVILRPNPLISSSTNTPTGIYVCNSADHIGLTSATGSATG